MESPFVLLSFWNPKINFLIIYYISVHKIISQIEYFFFKFVARIVQELIKPIGSDLICVFVKAYRMNGALIDMCTDFEYRLTKE